jgi:phage-related protein
MAARKAEVLFVGDAKSVVRAAQQASGATKTSAGEIEKSHARVRRSFSLLSKAAGVAGIGIGVGLAAGLKKSVDAYREAETSNAKLQAQLKSMGASYKAHAKEIDAVIQKTSKLAGLDDEDLQDAFTNIVRSTKSVKTGMHDMALVADLARAKHMDVAKAGELVAKVHAGNVGPLKRMGIEFTKSTKNVDALRAANKKVTPEQLKAAKAADQQANSTRALSLLQSRVKGQAAEFGKTGAGAQERMAVATENLQEAIGRGLSPALATVQQKVADFVNQIVEGTGSGGQFRDTIVDTFQEIKSNVAAFGDVAGPVFDKAVSMFKSLPGPAKIAAGAAAALGAIFLATGPLGLGIAALVAGVVLIKRNWSTIGPIFDTVKNAVVGAFNATVAAVQAGVNWITTAFANTKRELASWKVAWAVLGAIVTYAKAEFAVIKATITTEIKAAVAIFKAVLPGIVAVARSAFAGVKQAIAGGIQVIRGFVQVIRGILKGDFGQIWNGVKTIVSGALKAAWGVVRAQTAAARAAMGAVGRAALSALSSAWTGIKAVVAGAFSKIAAGIRGATGAVRSAASSVVKGAVDVIHNLGARFLQLGGNVIQGFIDGIKSKAGDIVDTIKKYVTDKIPGFVKKAFGISSPSRLFAQYGRWTIEGFVKGLISSSGSVTDAANKSLLFPMDAAITALNAKKDRLQKTWDAIDARAQRADLVAAVRTAKAGSRVSTGGTGGTTGSSSGVTARGVGTGVIGGGKYLQGLGLQVAESKYFGGVTTNAHAHYKNDHYSGNSIDVNAAGGGSSELAKLKTALAKLKAKFASSIQQAFIEDANTANQHLHVTFKTAGSAASAAKAVGSNVSAAMSKVTGKTSGKLTANQMRGLLYAQGFRGHDLDVAVAVGMAESAGKIKATNKNTDGSTDRGFMQINSVHGKLSTYDPTGNAAAAKKIHDDAGSFAPWTTFKSGAYKKFMNNTGSGKGTASASSSGTATSNVKERAQAIKDAVKQLKDFDTQATRTAAAAKIDLKIKGLEQLKAYKDAISGVKDQLKDMASQAAQSFRTMREGQIDKAHDDAVAAIQNGSPEALELAGLQATDKAQQDAKDWQDVQDSKTDADQAVADAYKQLQQDGSKAYKDEWQKTYDDAVKKQQDAADAVEAYKRKKREDELTDSINNAVAQADGSRDKAKDGLDQETTNFQNNLQAQLDLLNDNLEQRKTSYAQWAKSVNDILKPYGLSVATDAGAEAAITSGPGALAPSVNGKPIDLSKWVTTSAQVPGGTQLTYGDGHTEFHASSVGSVWSGSAGQKKRAVGGWVYPGTMYQVNELGKESFTPAVKGRITQASQSRSGSGGNVIVQGDLVVKRSSDADRVAYRLARALL